MLAKMNGFKVNSLEDVDENPVKPTFRLNGNRYTEKDDHFTGKNN